MLMKKFLQSIIMIIILSFLSQFIQAQSHCTLKGKIIDSSNMEVLICATVSVYKDGILVSGTITDFEGKYILTELDTGAYTIKASYIGYTSTSIDIVLLAKATSHTLDIQLRSGVECEEIVVINYKIPFSTMDYGISDGAIVTSSSIKSIPKKDISDIAGTSSGLVTGKEDISIRGSRVGITSFYMDGVKMRGDMPSSSDIVLDATTIKPKESTKAGQITAAEWNDLQKWDDWKELLETDEFKTNIESWKVLPSTRYAVFITNDFNLPVVDIKVNLVSDKGEVLWEARTDNFGKAELWTKDKNVRSILHLEVISDEEILYVQNAIPINKGVNTVLLNQTCNSPKNIDIMFVVDATSSMIDEISYLKAELKDVLEQVETQSDISNMRTASIFYRDSTDKYVTKLSKFNNDITETYRFINEQSAGGGGDSPEAVDAALEVALSQSWSKKALSRLLFLVLDAPPHHTKATEDRIKRQIKMAAKKGIKIIPITASGINRDTEFLMKFFSIATNGTYVFITDDSGIGNSHLAPVVKDFEIEFLNNLIARIIISYSKFHGCEKTIIENETNSVFSCSIFPNPASELVHIISDDTIDNLVIYSSSGKKVLEYYKIDSKSHDVDISSLVDGAYYVRIISGNKNKTVLLIKN